MARTVSMIGIEADELCWVRLLLSLLRHPDPSMPELARQALGYLLSAAGDRGKPRPRRPAPAAAPLIVRNDTNLG